MNLLREYIRGKLIEQASGKGSLIVVDIQPEYESGATFDIGDMLRAAAEYDEVLFLYNGADTLGMIDEGGLRNYYFEKLDYDEEVFEEVTKKGGNCVLTKKEHQKLFPKLEY